MDQTQQQNNNQITDDFNVTVKVDPSTLPQNQVSDDLNALKQAETFMTGKVSDTQLNVPKPKPQSIFRTNQPQELQALQLKNPFRGE